MKCHKCNWTVTNHKNHEKICKYRYGIDYRREHQITLKQQPLKKFLDGKGGDKQLKFIAGIAEWQVKFFYENTDNIVELLMVDINYKKFVGLNKQVQTAKICFALSLEINEAPETAYLSRHRFVESYKWTKHSDSWTVMLIKIDLLRTYLSEHPNAQLTLKIAPTLKMLDPDQRTAIEGCDNSFFTKIYRNIGSDLNKRKYRNVLDYLAATKEVTPEFSTKTNPSKPQKRKIQQDGLEMSIFSDTVSSNIPSSQNSTQIYQKPVITQNNSCQTDNPEEENKIYVDHLKSENRRMVIESLEKSNQIKLQKTQIAKLERKNDQYKNKGKEKDKTIQNLTTENDNNLKRLESKNLELIESESKNLELSRTVTEKDQEIEKLKLQLVKVVKMFTDD